MKAMSYNAENLNTVGLKQTLTMPANYKGNIIAEGSSMPKGHAVLAVGGAVKSNVNDTKMPIRPAWKKP